MKFFLIVAKGAKQGMPIPIEVDLFTIGSGKACQLRAIHEKIGGQHCAIVRRERKIFIRDLNTDLSTLVNGDAIPAGMEWPLHAGDIIEVGPLRFVMQYNERELSQRDLEEWALKCLDLDSERKITAIDRIEATTSDQRVIDNPSDAASAILDRLSAQRGIVKGRLRISREEGITVVRVNDVYLVEEAELSLIKKELHDNLNRANLKILLDMKYVRRMSTTAVQMLAEFIRWLRPFGSKLAITRLKPELQEMLMNFPDAAGIKFIADKALALQGNW